MNKLPEELVNKIKEYVLTTDILLKLFYQKHELTENKLKKKLSSFTSKQLEEINWKYLYYKIYKTSPPRYDNNNLVPIFNELTNPRIHTCLTFDEDDDYDYEPLVIYNPNAAIFHYQLNCITRSDYYPENVHTEKGRKTQQYRNIVDGWGFIHQGNIISATTPPVADSITDKVYQYLLNMEYELIRAIFIMS